MLFGVKRWGWFGIGAAAGYVLGTRSGRERYEQIQQGASRLADQVGLRSASEKIMGQARQAGSGLKDTATTTASGVVGAAADRVSSAMQAVTPSGGESGSPQGSGPQATVPQPASGTEPTKPLLSPASPLGTTLDDLGRGGLEDLGGGMGGTTGRTYP